MSHSTGTPKPTKAVVYSTDTVHPRERLAYWVEVATKGFVRCGFHSTAGSRFQGSVRLGSLATVGVAGYDCDSAQIARTPRDVARDDNDDLVLTQQISGRTVWSQDGRQAVLESGSFILIDARRPSELVIPARSKSVAFKFPRRALEARLGHVAALTARGIGGSGVSALASGFLAMVLSHLDALNGVAAPRVAEHAIDLVALAFSEETNRSDVAFSSPKAVGLVRLKAAIDARLFDAELRPADAAAAAGISVRYANALLALEGTSVESYIYDRRLDRCRQMLEDPRQDHRTISNIAFGWGFSDVAHFGRRFKAAFGLTPSDYRKEARRKPRAYF
jgi:AraC-like DNA-binding protein